MKPLNPYEKRVYLATLNQIENDQDRILGRSTVRAIRERVMLETLLSTQEIDKIWLRLYLENRLRFDCGSPIGKQTTNKDYFILPSGAMFYYISIPD